VAINGIKSKTVEKVLFGTIELVEGKDYTFKSDKGVITLKTPAGAVAGDVDVKITVDGSKTYTLKYKYD
jgi:hypothetical protein